jgi:hypothetical protein
MSKEEEDPIGDESLSDEGEEFLDQNHVGILYTFCCSP